MKQKFKIPSKNNSMTQLLIPLLALAALIIFNLIRDPSFFAIKYGANSDGNMILTGNPITVFDNASELAILAMGMTLVTAVSGGQDISVGANAAIAGSVFFRILRETRIASGIHESEITVGTMVFAFLISCVVAMLFGAFNGTLVSIFKIQPMIATLILFTTGRSIAFWISQGKTPTIGNPYLKALGGVIPGISIPTSIFVVIICGILFMLVLKVTNLGLYVQAVGINEKSSRLNGINSTWIKLLAYIILGFCVAISGTLATSRMGLAHSKNLLMDIEMDAILAVAIGGNALSGGKFKMIGSVIGAYIIQGLMVTLFAMNVPSTDIKAYKAVVIILLVVIGSPVLKEAVGKLGNNIWPKIKFFFVKIWRAVKKAWVSITRKQQKMGRAIK